MLIAAIAVVAVPGKRAPGPFARDFEAYYAAGATWNAGGDPWSRDVWAVERTIPGVDASRDELLPFAGPAATLPLWSLLARLPFAAARTVWELVLLAALVLLAVCASALAHARLTLDRALSGVLFVALCGPVISALTLGQLALVAAAALALTLLLLERNASWTTVTAGIAALQPNLALPLLARCTTRRATVLLAGGAALFLAATLLVGGGANGLATYLQRLAEHDAAERFIVIQFGVPAIAHAFGLGATAAVLAGDLAALIAVAAAAFAAIRFRDEPRVAAAIAIALLPWAVPFFHEHDFAIEVIPALLFAAAADARVRALAAFGALGALVNWLGIAQRPDTAALTAALALALACALAALPNRALRATSRRPIAVAFALCTLVALPLGLAFPAPVWPDALGAFHAPVNAGAAAVWGAEQLQAGLGAIEPAWSVVRLIPLTGCLCLAAAGYVAAITTRPARTANGTAVSASPSHGPSTQ